ncbi:MAG: zf-HC2 domain-containing protein [Gemmatimonadota bacterium]|nr:zf-HC2 domain-containing protein [Gemmatimonadota bacterium]
MAHLSRFTCEDAFRRLDDYLDRELGRDEMTLVREHLELCARCAGLFAFESGVLMDVRDKVRQMTMPADVRARVESAIARAPRA